MKCRLSNAVAMFPQKATHANGTAIKHQVRTIESGARCRAEPLLSSPADCVGDAVAEVDLEPVSAVWDERKVAVAGRIVVDFSPIPPGPNDTDSCPDPTAVVS